MISFITQIVPQIVAHIHASTGPHGAATWIELPHVAAGLSLDWAGNGIAQVTGWFQS